MKPSKLSIQKIFRKGGSGSTKRISIDFIVNDKSLLEILGESENSDLMGCFVEGYEQENENALKLLLCSEKSNLLSGRVLLYICPECGDIGCGALAGIIKKNKNQYIWTDFAFENGYEEPTLISINPFYFNEKEYETILLEASNI